MLNSIVFAEFPLTPDLHQATLRLFKTSPVQDANANHAPIRVCTNLFPTPQECCNLLMPCYKEHPLSI